MITAANNAERQTPSAPPAQHAQSVAKASDLDSLWLPPARPQEAPVSRSAWAARAVATVCLCVVHVIAWPLTQARRGLLWLAGREDVGDAWKRRWQAAADKAEHAQNKLQSYVENHDINALDGQAAALRESIASRHKELDALQEPASKARQIASEQAKLQCSLSTLQSQLQDARRRADEAESQAKTFRAERDKCEAAYTEAAGVTPKDPARALSQRAVRAEWQLDQEKKNFNRQCAATYELVNKRSRAAVSKMAGVAQALQSGYSPNHADLQNLSWQLQNAAEDLAPFLR